MKIMKETTKEKMKTNKETTKEKMKTNKETTEENLKIMKETTEEKIKVAEANAKKEALEMIFGVVTKAEYINTKKILQSTKFNQFITENAKDLEKIESYDDQN